MDTARGTPETTRGWVFLSGNLEKQDLLLHNTPLTPQQSSGNLYIKFFPLVLSRVVFFSSFRPSPNPFYTLNRSRDSPRAKTTIFLFLAVLSLFLTYSLTLSSSLSLSLFHYKYMYIYIYINSPNSYN